MDEKIKKMAHYFETTRLLIRLNGEKERETK